MTPNEVFLIIETHRPKHVNGIHEDDLERMEHRKRELEASGYRVG